MSVAIHGIMTDAVFFGNLVGRAPVNPFLLNSLALGMPTDIALGLMPPEVEATTLIFLKLLLIVGTYLLLHVTPLILLR